MSAQPTFHIWQQNQSRGPFTMSMLQGMLKAGDLTHDTLIARNGMDDWLPLARYAEVVQTTVAEIDPALLPDSAIAQETRTRPDAWTIICGAMAAAGLLVMLYYFTVFKVTVAAEAAAQTANLALISERESGMIFGAALFLGGCVLFARKR